MLPFQRLAFLSYLLGSLQCAFVIVPSHNLYKVVVAWRMCMSRHGQCEVYVYSLPVLYRPSFVSLIFMASLYFTDFFLWHTCTVKVMCNQ